MNAERKKLGFLGGTFDPFRTDRQPLTIVNTKPIIMIIIVRYIYATPVLNLLSGKMTVRLN